MNDKYAKYLRSNPWNRKKQEAFSLFGRKCKKCSSEKNLCIHHGTYDRVFEENVKTDLFVLCTKCHDLYHTLLKGKTTIKKTRDFINDKYDSLLDVSKYDKDQERLKRKKITKKQYIFQKNQKQKVKVEKVRKELRKNNVKESRLKFARTNYDMTEDRLKKILDIQNAEKISNLKKMLFKGKITQEYFDKSIKEISS